MAYWRRNSSWIVSNAQKYCNSVIHRVRIYKFYFCFGEGVGGDAANLISKMENISYAEAKKIVDGEVSLQEDMMQMLDSVAVKDDVDYADQLNFSISKNCRDLMTKVSR